MEKRNSSLVIIKYLQELSKKTDNQGASTIVFRGQANKEWGIESSAFRRLKIVQSRLNQSDFVDYHVDILYKARQHGFGFKKDSGRELHDLELLAEIQHRGGATCLTDFTKNFLIALWFATEEYCDESGIVKDGKIYIVKIVNDFSKSESWGIICDRITRELLETIDKQTGKLYTIDKILKYDIPGTSEIEKIFRRKEPQFWYWEPEMLNSRIVSQDSVFIFGLPNTPPQHHEIIIKAEDKKILRKELSSLFNIRNEVIFNDFNGFAYDANNSQKPFAAPHFEVNCYERGFQKFTLKDFESAKNLFSQAILCKELKTNKSSGDTSNNVHCICDNGFCYKDDISRKTLYFYRGVCFSRLKKNNLAIIDFKIALNKPFEWEITPEAYHFLAWAYYDESLFEDALCVYEDMIDNNIEVSLNSVNIVEIAIIIQNKDVFNKYLEIIKNQKAYREKNQFKLLYHFYKKIGEWLFNNCTPDAISAIEELKSINIDFKNFDFEFYWWFGDIENWAKNSKCKDNEKQYLQLITWINEYQSNLIEAYFETQIIYDLNEEIKQ